MKVVFCGRSEVNFTNDNGRSFSGLNVYLAIQGKDFVDGFSIIQKFYVPGDSALYSFCKAVRICSVCDAEFEPDFVNDRIRLKLLKQSS